jgi:hypothetical protein
MIIQRTITSYLHIEEDGSQTWVAFQNEATVMNDNVAKCLAKAFDNEAWEAHIGYEQHRKEFVAIISSQEETDAADDDTPC